MTIDPYLPCACNPKIAGVVAQQRNLVGIKPTFLHCKNCGRVRCRILPIAFQIGAT